MCYYGVQWDQRSVGELEGVWGMMGYAGRVGLGVSVVFFFIYFFLSCDSIFWIDWNLWLTFSFIL